MGQALARRVEDEERALALGNDGRRTGDGAALTRALSRRYGDRNTGEGPQYKSPAMAHRSDRREVGEVALVD